jgi:hypothetical protein
MKCDVERNKLTISVYNKTDMSLYHLLILYPWCPGIVPTYFILRLHCTVVSDLQVLKVHRSVYPVLVRTRMPRKKTTVPSFPNFARPYGRRSAKPTYTFPNCWNSWGTSLAWPLALLLRLARYLQ